MSTPIRERILEEAEVIVGAITGIGTIRRWDGTGQTTYAHLDCILWPAAEASEDAAIGNPGPVRCKMQLVASVVLLPDETETLATDELVNRWTGNLKHAFLGDRFFTTAGGVQLAIDSMPVEVSPPEFLDGASAAAIRVDIVYQHNGNSVYALGTIIPSD